MLGSNPNNACGASRRAGKDMLGRDPNSARGASRHAYRCYENW
jgi:hypothetical protein